MFEGSVINEQGVTFAVVVVRKHTLDNRTEADHMIAAFQDQIFQGIPVVLMAQDYRGVPTYYGRKDISGYMSNVPLNAIPWKKYTVTLQ